MAIKFCPECKSKDILISPTVLEAATGINPEQKCNNCSFRSIVFPEVEDED